MELSKLISCEKQSSVLLLGKSGLSMREDAFSFAKFFLGTDNLDLHPDYLFVSTEKRSYSVDSLLPISQKAYNVPVLSPFTIIIIDEMEKMTVQCQNKLLLLLENNPNCIIIGICYRDNLLQTVKSRMRIIPYTALNRNDFLQSCEMPVENGKLFFTVSGGILSMKDFFTENMSLFRQVRAICRKDSGRGELFSVLNLVKEKDNASVTNSVALMKAVLSVMANTFMELAIVKARNSDSSATRYMMIAAHCLNDMDVVENQNYTKDDFFLTIAKAVEL